MFFGGNLLTIENMLKYNVVVENNQSFNVRNVNVVNKLYREHFPNTL